MSWVGRGEGRGENLGEFFAFTILSQIRPSRRQFRKMKLRMKMTGRAVSLNFKWLQEISRNGVSAFVEWRCRWRTIVFGNNERLDGCSAGIEPRRRKRQFIV